MMLIVAASALLVHGFVLPGCFFTSGRSRQLRCAASDLESLADALPYLSDPALLAADVRYTGLGLALDGREAYSAAASAWQRELPRRLAGLEVTAKTVLPPDARRTVSARYSLEFQAPIPPQVLPAQRARVLAAGMPTSGLVAVRATVIAALELDADGRVRRHTEQLVTDPFAVSGSIAHFELLNARAHALLPDAAPPPLRAPLAYWRALRGMMRIELEPVRLKTAAKSMPTLPKGKSRSPRRTTVANDETDLSDFEDGEDGSAS